MANKDFPSGLRPYTEGGSARPRLREYPIGASVTIYAGSPLKILATGGVDIQNTATGTVDNIGVAAHYVATGAGETGTVLVWDDPDQEFVIQSDGSNVAADVGLNSQFVTPNSGDTTTNQSIAELDASAVAITATLPLRILGKANRIDNDWGTHVDLVVKFNPGRHALGQATGL